MNHEYNNNIYVKIIRYRLYVQQCSHIIKLHHKSTNHLVATVLLACD